MRSPFSRSPADPAPADGDAVQAARTRARRRLVGALVLLVAGVIGFPLLFETQPRPLPVDTPIVAPAREAMPAPRASTLPRPVLPADAGNEVPAPAAAPDASAAPAAAQAASGAATPRPGGQASPAPAAAAVPVPPVAAARAASAAPSAPRASARAASQARPVARTPPGADERAQATTGLRPAVAASTPTTGRFVVQVGAYTDAGTLRDARGKVERLGLKTFTQVIENDGGKRTRVRVGPFATREEAAAAAGRIKAAGLPANILAL